MTIPVEYETASTDFAHFMETLTSNTGHTTSNMAWGTLLGVFEVFRRRLTIEQAIDFARSLPTILRAVFVADIHPRDPLPFADRTALIAEVRSVHQDHQFATETAIDDVAAALRAHADLAAFDKMLSRLPPEAAAFWRS